MNPAEPAGLGRRDAARGRRCALPLFAIRTRPADAAEFTYKLATGQDPTHPVNKRSQEAIDRIREATGGRLEIRLFPANQLGSDTDLLGQVRNGGVEFFNEASSILATLVPAAGIVNVGFAFSSRRPGLAGDGRRRSARTSSRRSRRSGLLTASPCWANGFREITSSTKPIQTPDDLKGFKIRVPASPILTSLFQALGAGPTPINFNELYSALQTKLVEGQENPLPIIATRQAVRGAAVLQPDQPRLGRLLDPRQPPRHAAAAEGHAGDRAPRVHASRQGRARRHRPAHRVAADKISAPRA